MEHFETFTNALSGTRAKRKPRKRFDVMNILFQESVRFENMWFRPVFRIVVDDIEWNPDQGSLLDDKSSKLSWCVFPILDTFSVIPGNWRIHSQIFLKILCLCSQFSRYNMFNLKYFSAFYLYTCIQVGHVWNGLMVNNTFKSVQHFIYFLQECFKDFRVFCQVEAKCCQCVGGCLKTSSNESNSLNVKYVAYSSSILMPIIPIPVL